MLEIERRWLVDYESANNCILYQSFASTTYYIQQNYLTSKKGESRRVRQVYTHKMSRGIMNAAMPSPKYYYTVKTEVSPGVKEEKEQLIAYDKYLSLLNSEIDPKRKTINKTRYEWEYQNQTLELDFFSEPLDRLVILEIELESIDQEVFLPSYLEILAEVTDNKQYSNSKLAKNGLPEAFKNFQ